MMLGTAYLASRGWAAVEIVQTLRPARDLAMRLGDDDQLVAILWLHLNSPCHALRVSQSLEVIGGAGCPGPVA